MKTFIKAALFTFIMSMAFNAVNAQQIFVNIRPERPRAIVRRPPPPSQAHVWVEEDWVPRGGTYVWHGGYWAAPPRPGAVYVPGHWSHTGRGHVWIAGSWKYRH
jgi:hypothetical protein